MATRDWDKELAKIDRQLESISDEALLPAKGAATPVAKAEVLEKQRTTTTFGVMARLTLAVALGVGMFFWPYSARCGAGLFAYLAAVGVLIGAGIWSSAWTWRHRSVRGHLLSLLIVLWGGILGAQEVLPRIGYAIPTEAHPATWMCQ
ncbi:MAG TPA: hypothetical protein VLE53_11860 [Gemmatimonadaceae bacterium]|nr:hypothetical protein [Gemmatimonadaceae bacterium]